MARGMLGLTAEPRCLGLAPGCFAINLNFTTPAPHTILSFFLMRRAPFRAWRSRCTGARFLRLQAIITPQKNAYETSSSPA